MAGLMAGIAGGVALKKSADRPSPSKPAGGGGALKSGKPSFRTELKTRMQRKQHSIMKKQAGGGSGTAGEESLDAMEEEDVEEYEGDEGDEGEEDVQAVTVAIQAKGAPPPPPPMAAARSPPPPVASPRAPSAALRLPSPTPPTPTPPSAPATPAWKAQIQRNKDAAISPETPTADVNDTKWAGVPAWKRKVLEEKAAKDAIKNAPQIAAKKRDDDRKVSLSIWLASSYT
jgi:hypothetical protein